MDNQYEKEYFDWLCSFVCDDEYDQINQSKSYSYLLEHLYARPFIAVVPRDTHRIYDGVKLRSRFCTDHGYSEDMLADTMDGQSCSIFEMMLALSLRCEDTIMCDDSFGNRTGEWFWTMLVNLGLGHMSNAHYDETEVDYILERFVNREYSPQGEGGLFVVKNPQSDMRKVEIWYQMCWYLTENF